MAEILLATCAAFPDGGPETHLPELFAARGVSARWGVWDEPDVEWAAADLVAVRATWDYASKLDEFISWTRVVAQQTRLVNAAEVIAWNTDKRYLNELSEWGFPTVPTVAVHSLHELEAALTLHDAAVVKPVVGVAGVGLQVWHRDDPLPAIDRPMLVQPLVDTVRTHGEVSVFVMGGRPVRQVLKVPADGEVRVHPNYGGRYEVQPLDVQAADLATSAIGKVAARFGVEIPYGRVDLLQLNSAWVVGEIEITEPGLYVDVDPGIAEAYADAIVATLEA